MTLQEQVVARKYGRVNFRILAGDDPALDRSETDNNLELNREEEERTLCRKAKVHDVLEMWQGSQNLHTTQKESRTQNKQMTTVANISDREESVKASWSNVQWNGVAASKLSERSPFPKVLRTWGLAGG